MASRDDAEDALALVVNRTTRTFLQRVLDSVVEAIRSGRTDQAQPVLALGVLLGWWTDEVNERVVESIRESWQAAFGATSRGRVSASPRSNAMAFHITAVKDRLSRSALPDIPETAFDQVRLSQSAAALAGWSTPEQSRDIAERLAWEPDKQYWKDQKALAEQEIDKILDPFGRPGTPARTQAHKHDPQVKVWQQVRAEAVERLREDESMWQERATRIARTESTAAWNSGALAALAEEGRTHKKWLATKDRRTRDSHLEANGQVVPLSRPFRVGESLLMMPGDPSGPPYETINCRCTVIGADEPLPALTAAGFNEDQLRIPRGNGDLSGRWMDSPLKILQDLMVSLAEIEIGGEAETYLDRAINDAADNFDPRNETTRDLGQVWDQMDEANSATTDGEASRLITAAMGRIDELNDVDWSLFNEATDIKGTDIGEIEAEDTDIDVDLPFGWNKVGDEWRGPDGWSVTVDTDGETYWVWNDDGSLVTEAATLEEALRLAQRELDNFTRDPLQEVKDYLLLNDDALEQTERSLADLFENEEDRELQVQVMAGMTARINKRAKDLGLNIVAVPQEFDPSSYELSMTWKLQDWQGNNVGTIERKIHHSDRTVYNEYFQILPTYQGGGFAAGITQDLEAWYASNGVDQIKVHANIDVGGYTWARLGFELDTNESGTHVLQSAIESIIPYVAQREGSTTPFLDRYWGELMEHAAGAGSYEQPNPDPEVFEELERILDPDEWQALQDLAEESEGDASVMMYAYLDAIRQNVEDPNYHRGILENWLTAINNGNAEDWPTMYDLAMFGKGTLEWQEEYKVYKVGQPVEIKTLTTWPGKQALLGTDWYGVKDLGGY